MTAIEPQVSDTGRYSIKETCEHLKINRGTLSAHTKPVTSVAVSVVRTKGNSTPELRLKDTGKQPCKIDNYDRSHPYPFDLRHSSHT